MLVAKEFSITRSGTLQFNVWGPNHCGPVNYLHGGTCKVKYRVELTALTALDEKGFLIDNMFLSSFMEEAARQGTDLSCELLLESLATRLQSTMQDAEPSLEVTQLVLSLSPDFGPDNIAEMCIRCY